MLFCIEFNSPSTYYLDINVNRPKWSCINLYKYKTQNFTN